MKEVGLEANIDLWFIEYQKLQIKKGLTSIIVLC